MVQRGAEIRRRGHRRMCGRMAAGGFLPRPPRASSRPSAAGPPDSDHPTLRVRIRMTETSRSIEPVRRIPWPVPGVADPESLVTREWLVANGLGGYASGTVAGVVTRRYHGPLIAALGAPFGGPSAESHRGADSGSAAGRSKSAAANGPRSPRCPRDRVSGRISSRGGPPRMALRSGRLRHREAPAHAVHAEHRPGDVRAVCAPARRTGRRIDGIELVLRPSVNFRHQEAPVSEPLGSPYQLHADGNTTKSGSPEADFRRCG